MNRRPRWNGDWLGCAIAVVGALIILGFVFLVVFNNH